MYGTMETRSTPVEKLYRQLHDKTCLCDMIEANQTSEQLSSFAHWITGFTDESETGSSSCVLEHKHIAVEDGVDNRVSREDNKNLANTDTVSSHLTINTVPMRSEGASTFDSNTTESQVCEPDGWLRFELGQTSLEESPNSGHSSLKRTGDKSDSRFSKTDGNCFLKRKVSAGVNEIDRSVKRCATERMMGQVEENHQGDDDDEEDTTECKEAGEKDKSNTVDEDARDTEQAGGEFSAVSRKQEASRDRTLLCLTVGKELFGGMTHCEQVYRLQHEMISKGLLDDLGLLMVSDDRLVAFMACKMMVAILLSPILEKERVTTLLKYHLIQCNATINTTMQNAGHQNGSWVNPDQANPDLPNNTQPHQEHWVHTCREVNPGQVIQGRVNSSQVKQEQVTSCQDNPDEVNACQGYNLDHAALGGQVNQGHFSLGQVNSAQVKQDHNLNPSQVNPSHNNLHVGRINHAIFTFDLCRLLLKMLSTKSSQLEGECQHGGKEAGRQTCKRRSETQTGQQRGRLKDLQAEVTHLLYKNLPDTSLAFMQASRKLHKSTRARVDDDDHRGSLLILASLLDLNHALIKWGPVDQHWCRFTQKSLPPLMNLLMQYCSDVIILKKILDIFILSMDQSAPGTTHSSQSQPKSSQFAAAVDENSLCIATAFVDMIVKGNICDSLHYRSGTVGFGGGNFQSSDGDDAMEGIESGDRPLLRKLCRSTLSAMRVCLTFDNSKRRLIESDIDKCFKALSSYTCRKLNLSPTADLPTWLFELFADQDDCLVWAMLCMLNLHRSTHPHTFLENQLNPHKVFTKFLDTVAHDPSVLLDLLISSETLFLQYLVQYLHTVISDWDLFCCSHQDITSATSRFGLEQTNFDIINVKDNDEGYRVDDTSVGMTKVPIGHQHLNESTTSCGQHEDRNAPRSKRRQREIQKEIGASSQVTTPAVAYQSDHDTSSLTPNEIKRTLTNNSSNNLLEDTIVFSDINKNNGSMNNQINGLMSQSLEDVMTTLIRLRFLIKRISGSDLFPYPVGPLLRLLEQVEDIYEG